MATQYQRPRKRIHLEATITADSEWDHDLDYEENVANAIAHATYAWAETFDQDESWVGWTVSVEEDE